LGLPEASLLSACHRHGIVSVLLAVPDEHILLDVFEAEAFSSCHRHTIPGGGADALPEGLGQASTQGRGHVWSA
jgi:hypothetical protein